MLDRDLAELYGMEIKRLNELGKKVFECLVLMEVMIYT